MSEDQKQPVEEKNEDNLMAELNAFNEGSSPEESKEEAKAESTDTEEVKSDKPVEKEAEKESPEEVSQVEQWLIENKFKNDEEGVSKLAEAYKQLQSKSDKERNEFQDNKERYSKLDQLDQFLAENPDVVQNLTKEVQRKQQDVNSPPVKPDDYDILDEGIENSSSAQWRAEHDQWLIRQGAAQAIGEVEKLKSELSESQAFDAETIELQKMGLSDAEVVEYRQFMADPNNVTQENLVNIWKTLSQHNGNNSNTKVADTAEPKPKNKQTSAAAVSGSPPPAKEPEQKVVDEFWKGIMEFNNTNNT